MPAPPQEPQRNGAAPREHTTQVMENAHPEEGLECTYFECHCPDPQLCPMYLLQQQLHMQQQQQGPPNMFSQSMPTVIPPVLWHLCLTLLLFILL